LSGQKYQDVVRLLPKMRRFAYGLSGSLEAAEDLVQEACIRLLHQKEEKNCYIDRWLFRTIRNLHVDQIRKKAVTEKYHHHFAADMGDSRLDGNAQMETLEALDHVRTAITRLPEEQRTIILLIGVEGFSYRETAEMLGMPIGTVTSRLALARKKLLSVVSDSQINGDSLCEVI